MEIPYTVRPRPDTGLTNPKLGIWLFLASEVMLFGGLFAGYIFMRLGSEPWMWPHGWLNVPVGTKVIVTGERSHRLTRDRSRRVP